MTKAPDDLDIEWLPDLLRAMAQGLGLAVMLRFAADFGGREITLPAKATAAHPIAKSIGLPALRWLLKHRHPGEKIGVPPGPAATYTKRIVMIRRLLKEGVDTVEIIRRLGVHQRTIRRHRAMMRDTPKQPDLFE